MLVNAMGVRSYNPLQEQLEGLDCKVIVVGDASSTKNGYKNIREGFNAGTRSDFLPPITAKSTPLTEWRGACEHLRSISF